MGNPISKIFMVFHIVATEDYCGIFKTSSDVNAVLEALSAPGCGDITFQIRASKERPDIDWNNAYADLISKYNMVEFVDITWLTPSTWVEWSKWSESPREITIGTTGVIVNTGYVPPVQTAMPNHVEYQAIISHLTDATEAMKRLKSPCLGLTRKLLQDIIQESTKPI